MKMYLFSTLKSLRLVFSRPSQILIAIFAAGLILFIANILPNYQFVSYVVGASSYDLVAKIKIIFSLSEYFRLNETITAQVLLLLTSFLAGVNISLASYYFKRKIAADRLAGIGFLGIAGSFFGVGCSSCGSVLLSSFIGIGASTQLIKFLPLRGAEISILSMLLLMTSIVYISERIQNPNVCRIS